MLSLPHLVLLFVIALIVFGPQKLPELARMLGKATAEFRKMSTDFRYALEDEVREMERQTRIRDEEIAAAAKAAQQPASPAAETPAFSAPEGTQSRELPAASAETATATAIAESEPEPTTYSAYEHLAHLDVPAAPSSPASPEPDSHAVVSNTPQGTSQEKPTDDAAV